MNFLKVSVILIGSLAAATVVAAAPSCTSTAKTDILFHSVQYYTYPFL